MDDKFLLSPTSPEGEETRIQRLNQDRHNLNFENRRLHEKIDELQKKVYQLENRTAIVTPRQAEVLLMPFSPEKFELKDGKIYLPHQVISDRFNEAFGVARWNVRRRGEPRVERYKEIKRKQLEDKSYTEYDVEVSEWLVTSELFYDGCFVAEGTDSAKQYSDNRTTSAADAISSAESKTYFEIFKRLGGGWQVKDKAFIAEFNKKYANRGVKNVSMMYAAYQLDYAYKLVKGDDRLTINFIRWLAPKTPNFSEMEAKIDTIRKQKARRAIIFSDFMNTPDVEAFFAEYAKEGFSKEEIDSLVEPTKSLAYNDNKLLSLIEDRLAEIRRTSLRKSMEDLYGDEQQSQAEVKKSEQQKQPLKKEQEEKKENKSEPVEVVQEHTEITEEDLFNAEVPRGTKGQKLIKDKNEAWYEQSSTMLKKFYDEAVKPDSTFSFMKETYRDAMMIKVAVKFSVPYSSLSTMDFDQLYAKYKTSPNQTDMFHD